ncbi:MAG: hypothetical protein KF700_11205 [Hyphomonadaceae bacterium]|nr:hypothetical protein [Hyphomonadaceae bacterium]
MATKWVDNEVYFGPDRRRRDAGKRWGDRRRLNDAGEPPPLGALLRRLRVQLLDLSTASDRHRAIQLANLAIVEAERKHLPACADAVKEAAACINAGDTAGADAWLTQAVGAL